MQNTGYEKLSDKQLLDEIRNKKPERLRDTAYLIVMALDLQRHIREQRYENHKTRK